MAKKCGCRRNEKERSDHERAVALRKMPDSQLVDYVQRQYQAGVNAGRIGVKAAEREAADRIIQSVAGIKGIGAATLAKIQAAVEGTARHA